MSAAEDKATAKDTVCSVDTLSVFSRVLEDGARETWLGRTTADDPIPSVTILVFSHDSDNIVTTSHDVPVATLLFACEGHSPTGVNIWER